ncbi:U3 snoRNA-associated small subunit rRNA processing protein, putative [Plasmodium sp. gorilla clade G3]|nr:U3 snoRNA-associated small subunit rRNA processing protein, putative [Plasmodium sp. gorilla clade G3]
MSIISNIEIEKKFFDFYEGDKNIYFCKEYEAFLCLCDNNLYCFKIDEEKNSKYSSLYDILYPTCILESCVDIDDIKENYQKKYLNKHCISLFSSIRYYYYCDNNVFLSTDDNNIHHYLLVYNNNNIKANGTYDVHNYDYIKNGEQVNNNNNNNKDIYLYERKEDIEGEGNGNDYSYSYNWIYLEKKKIWKSENIVVSCFYYKEDDDDNKKLIVGYNNGLINVYNINTYKLKISYKIHNTRITNLKFYKNFIISSDVTKNIFIYDIIKRERIISYEDHMGGIIDLLFLEVPNGKNEKKTQQNKVDKDGIMIKEEDDDISNGDSNSDSDNGIIDNDNDDEKKKLHENSDEKLIGFISIGNDKIMNVWDLNILNSYNEEDMNNLISNNNLSKKKNNKSNKYNKNNNLLKLNPIKQFYLSSDINHAVIIPSIIFQNENNDEKKKKRKFIITDENIKWLILTHDNDGNLLIYNPIKGDVIYKYKENINTINPCNISKFFLLKYFLYIFREDSSLLIYDIRYFKLLKNYICKLEGIFEILFFNPKSEQFICDQKYSIHNKYEDEDDEEEDMLYKTSNEEKMKKKKCVILLGDNIIRILKFKNNLISQTLLIGHEDIVSCIKLNEKNLLLFSASNDKNIFIWSLRNYYCLYMLKDNLYPINAIDVNLKHFPSITLVSVCEDSSLRLWKCTVDEEKLKKNKSNKKKRKFEDIFDNKESIQSTLTIYPHKVLINDIAISPNCKLVATCSKDKTVKIFEAQNLKLIHILEGHKKSVQNVYFSKNDNILYSNSYECVRIWSLNNFECLKSIQSLDFNITRVLILNDSCMINGYSNGNISIINIKNCEKLLTINYHKDKIFCLQSYEDKNKNNNIISASINGELIFFKDISDKIITEHVFEKRKNIFYENCLENLLKEKKINESLLICLKLDKKYKFKTIVENYLNYYTFSILNILKKYQHEYGIKQLINKDKQINNRDINNNNNIIKKEQNFNQMKNLNNNTLTESSTQTKISINIKESHENIVTNKADHNNMDNNNFYNIFENSDFLESYIFKELSYMQNKDISEEAIYDKNVRETEINKSTNVDNKKDEKNDPSVKHINSNDSNDTDYNSKEDDNFVLFLKKMKKKSEHSYFLYLNKLMEFITFFVVNHRCAYISNFLLNSIIKYIDHEDICKINNYQYFFEVYNSYIPRHKNRYVKSLQKSKCFELININYYKGDIKMMS